MPAVGETMPPCGTSSDRIDDYGLLKLVSESLQNESAVREIFAKRYTNKYFLINGRIERHQKKYSEIFKFFGESIRAVQINCIQNMNANHWLLQLLNKQAPNLEKLYFKKCLFIDIDDFFAQHIKITHLKFSGGLCEQRNVSIQLPEYRNLKSLELVNFRHVSKSSLEQVICNNPQMERLVLGYATYECCYFNMSDAMTLIFTHLKNLKELNLMDCHEFNSRFSFISLDKFVSGLASLESFGMTVMYDWERGLLKRVKSACENIKHLELHIINYTKETIKLISSFDQIESLQLAYCPNQGQLEAIIESLPNLRCISVSCVTHCTYAQILTRLREFITKLPNSQIKFEFIDDGEVIGFVTKEETIWRNKILYWSGYDPIHNRSNLKLLDLASVPEGSHVKHKQPLNLILNYLDLSSLYSFAMVNKETKQLVHSYIYLRCKQSSKKRLKQRSIDRDKFHITDEFGLNFDGLRMFGKSIKYLEVNLLELDYHGSIHTFRNEIETHCKHLTKLCVRTRDRIDPKNFILPQIRHFIFYDYSSDVRERYTFHCDICNLSERCPNLEILEIRTVAKLHMLYYRKQKISFKNLRKLKFKPFDDSQVKYAKELFKDTGTEIVIDR